MENVSGNKFLVGIIVEDTLANKLASKFKE
jgi:hypothetical protein